MKRARSEPTTITFVTGNKGKLEEVKSILGLNDNGSQEHLPFNLVSQPIDLPEIQGTPQDIAQAKAIEAFRVVQGPVLIDDTCLCFNAMNGLPGPYIKWFLDSMGREGLYKMVNGFEDKTGYAMCLFTLTFDGKEVLFFEGRCEGDIVAPVGDSGFGWDPIFAPHEASKKGDTFASMNKEEKNTISHRYKGVTKLREYLQSAAAQKEGNTQA